jgi:hypothetical protein
MRALEFIVEGRGPNIRGQIQDAVRQHGGDPRDYFVRFTDVDKIGFSDRQKFKRHVEIDDPNFSVSSLGTSSRGGGRRALWFYPLRTYLSMMSQGEYAMEFPYVWLVKKRPDAWLQPIGHRDPREVKDAPAGQRRVGILKGGLTPQAVFFEPAFDVVDRFYDYAGQHQRHGEVKGRPELTFFDRVRGITETRQGYLKYIQSWFPDWPDYVIRDWLYSGAKGLEPSEMEAYFLDIADEYPVYRWELRTLNLRLDSFDENTQAKILERQGGSQNPMKVHRDAERHATQAQQIQKTGVASPEPIIVIQRPDVRGLELVEGWHRTIQNIVAFPNGYRGRAWIGYTE